VPIVPEETPGRVAQARYPRALLLAALTPLVLLAVLLWLSCTQGLTVNVAQYRFRVSVSFRENLLSSHRLISIGLGASRRPGLPGPYLIESGVWGGSTGPAHYLITRHTVVRQ
jgi:hypothetical protein